MGLYLCIFDEDEEIEGIDVGAYSDFADLRNTIAKVLEGGSAGSRFPTLMIHSDSEGEWSAEECKTLGAELEVIAQKFKELPPKAFFAEWQKGKAEEIGLVPSSLYECFIDIDGEPMLERLANLTKLATRKNLPIAFQ